MNSYVETKNWYFGRQFACFMGELAENELAFTLETTYFGPEDNKVDVQKLINLGHCFAREIREYIERK